MYKFVHDVFSFLNDVVDKNFNTPNLIENIMILIESVIKIGF